MEDIYKIIDIAVNNVKRFNNIKNKRPLTKEEWTDFRNYINILKTNDTGVYTSEVKSIIYNI